MLLLCIINLVRLRGSDKKNQFDGNIQRVYKHVSHNVYCLVGFRELLFGYNDINDFSTSIFRWLHLLWRVLGCFFGHTAACYSVLVRDIFLLINKSFQQSNLRFFVCSLSWLYHWIVVEHKLENSIKMSFTFYSTKDFLSTKTKRNEKLWLTKSNAFEPFINLLIY